MLDPSSLLPNDRVLLLGIPQPGLIAAIAGRLSNGLLVAMGAPGDVLQARRAARDLDNVMFVELSGDRLPWRDGFFSRAFILIAAGSGPAALAAEVRRVTAPFHG